MRTFIPFLSLLLSISLTAQTKIVGFVKLQSSGNQALPNAEVWAIGAASKPLRFSNDKGYFELEFPNKKIGDVIREISVTLDGYEVVNKKDLESYGLISQPEDDPLLIVLCKQGEYRKAAADYYETIYHAGEAELQAEKKRLEAALEQERKNRSALEQQLSDINKKLENLPQVAEAAANYFAKIDLDQATQLQQKALAGLKKGNIQAALDAMPEDVMDKNMATAQQRKQQFEAQLAEVNQVIKQSIENYLFKAQLYVSASDYTAAERLYEKAISNVHILSNETSKSVLSEIITELNNLVFRLIKNKFFLKARDLCLRTINKLVNSNMSYRQDSLTLVHLLVNIGNIYLETGDTISALKNTNNAFEIIEYMKERNLEENKMLMITSMNLGIIYQAKNENNLAEQKYLYAYNIYQTQFKDDLEDDLILQYAKLNNNLGKFYFDEKDLKKSKFYYTKSLEIKRDLANRNKIEFYLSELGLILINMGTLFDKMNEDEKALSFYEEAKIIYSNLYNKFPKVFCYEKAVDEFNLAQFYAKKMTKTFEMKDKEIGIKYLQDAKATILNCGSNINSKNLLSLIEEYEIFFEKQSDKKLLVKQVENLEKLNDSITNFEFKIKNRLLIIEKVNEFLLLVPTCDCGLHDNYGILSWYYLNAKKFSEAEQAARQGITLGGEAAAWIHTNLALALLYQGKYKEAEVIYQQFKGKAYDKERGWTEVFLADLDELEKAGITHSDVKKMRKLLRD